VNFNSSREGAKIKLARVCKMVKAGRERENLSDQQCGAEWRTVESSSGKASLDLPEPC
jgi:hypothetical protein